MESVLFFFNFSVIQVRIFGRGDFLPAILKGKFKSDQSPWITKGISKSSKKNKGFMKNS